MYGYELVMGLLSKRFFDLPLRFWTIWAIHGGTMVASEGGPCEFYLPIAMKNHHFSWVNQL